MIFYGSTPPFTYCKKKMDALFLGIFNAVPGCVLRVPGREPERAYG